MKKKLKKAAKKENTNMVQTAERVSHLESSDNPVLQRHLIAYKSVSDLISANILEIGCGEGYGIDYLLDKCKTYTGIDRFKSAAYEKYSDHEKVKLELISVPPLSGVNDNSFDFVVSFQVIEHIEDDHAFVKEIHRVLKPGGKAIITTPNIKMSLSRNPWHIREYTAEELKRIFQKHFSQVEMKGIFGNEKVMDYYEKNKASVKNITRFDIFNLQYRLPRTLLKIPYDILNRLNRNKLKQSNDQLVSDIKVEDYFIEKANDQCLDLFCIATK